MQLERPPAGVIAGGLPRETPRLFIGVSRRVSYQTPVRQPIQIVSCHTTCGNQRPVTPHRARIAAPYPTEKLLRNCNAVASKPPFGIGKSAGVCKTARAPP